MSRKCNNGKNSLSIFAFQCSGRNIINQYPATPKTVSQKHSNDNFPAFNIGANTRYFLYLNFILSSSQGRGWTILLKGKQIPVIWIPQDHDLDLKNQVSSPYQVLPFSFHTQNKDNLKKQINASMRFEVKTVLPP